MGPFKDGGEGVDVTKGSVRRGQVYSIIAVMIAIPILFFMTYYMESVQTLKFGASERVISDQLRETGRSIEDDFGRAVEISGIRACLGATDYMIREGEPLDNATQVLEELISDGTIFGNLTFVMFNNTLDDWRCDIYEMTPGFNLFVDHSGLYVGNHDGLNLMARVTLHLNISDKQETAKISKDVEKEVLVPVENIEDPIFPYHTNGVVPRSIRFFPYPYHAIRIAAGSQSSGNCTGNVTYDPSDPAPGNKILVTQNASGISGFAGVVGEFTDLPSTSCYVVGASGAVSLTQSLLNQSGWPELYLDQETRGEWSLPINDALEKGYYSSFQGSSGPDLLKRLEGNLEETTNGIETFVNIPELQGWGVPVKSGQISLAYIYFRDTTHAGTQVRGLPDWFRINSAYASRYNLTELM